MKSFLTGVCIWLFACAVFAQKNDTVLVVVQKGHANITGAQKIKFSASQDYILTLAEKEAILWETFSTRKLGEYSNGWKIYDAAISPQGDWVAIWSKYPVYEGFALELHHTHTLATQVMFKPDEIRYLITHITFAPNGKELYLYSTDKNTGSVRIPELYVVDIKSLVISRKISIPSDYPIYSEIGFTENGLLYQSKQGLVVLDNDGHIHTEITAPINKWSLVNNLLATLDTQGNIIVKSPDSKKPVFKEKLSLPEKSIISSFNMDSKGDYLMVSWQANKSEKYHFRVCDIQTGKIVWETTSPTPFAENVWILNKQNAIYLYGKNPVLYSFQQELKRSFEGKSIEITNIELKNGKLLNGYTLLDLAKGNIAAFLNEKLSALEGRTETSWGKAFLNDSVILRHFTQFDKSYNRTEGLEWYNWKQDNVFKEIALKEKEIYAFRLKVATQKQIAVSAGNRQLCFWDLKENKLIKEITANSNIVDVRISDSLGQLLLICSNDDLLNTKYEVLLYDLLTTQLLHKSTFSKRVTADFTTQKNIILLNENDVLIQEYDWQKKQFNEVFYGVPYHLSTFCYDPVSQQLAVGTQSGWVFVFNKERQIIAAFLKHSGHIRDLSFSEGYLASLGEDGLVNLYQPASKKHLAGFYQFLTNNQADYAIVTPENYYVMNKTSQQNLHFVKNAKSYTFDQFDLQYNRPDLVLQRIGLASQDIIESYRKAYEKRLKKMDFDPDNFDKGKGFYVPEIKILKPENLFLETKEQKFNMEILAKDAKYNLDRLNIYVNGVPLYGTKGRDLKSHKSTDYSESISLLLSNGKNIIETSILNEKGGESLKERLEVIYKPATVSKPVLHLITIGISQYQNTRMNLNYATKDGKDLGNLFQNQQEIYHTVKHYALFDKEASLNNILALKEKLKQTDIDDVVMLYISGHGLLDKNLDYYLATYDVDFTNPSQKGLAYNDLENLLDNISARQKVLLMDACHSGEIDKEEVEVVVAKNTQEGDITFRNFETNIQNSQMGLQNSFELSKQLFTDLRRGSGTTVISAASGVELAMEGGKWKNGVFTYCLLSGLKEKKADLNKDGKIMLSELQYFLFTQVPEVTGGRQQPTSRIENLTNDFRIW